ncbi:MAG: hypothetical protein N2053_12825 [Chitinispirillaceae bacterium]|nr:hypothetical protein [Chitinispirillaceae bacterium]
MALIKQIHISYDNQKGDAYTKRAMRITKEELIQLNEFGGFKKAKDIK